MVVDGVRLRWLYCSMDQIVPKWMSRPNNNVFRARVIGSTLLVVDFPGFDCVGGDGLLHILLFH